MYKEKFYCNVFFSFSKSLFFKCVRTNNIKYISFTNFIFLHRKCTISSFEQTIMISSNALSSKLGTNNEVYSQAKERFTYIIILVNKQL